MIGSAKSEDCKPGPWQSVRPTALEKIDSSFALQLYVVLRVTSLDTRRYWQNEDEARYRTVSTEVKARESWASESGTSEADHGVNVLDACESGSRASGFEVRTDIRRRRSFQHPPDCPAWYLSFDVERRPDVIEIPIRDDIDLSGWDVRKAMYLFTRTNGALHRVVEQPVALPRPGPVRDGPSAVGAGALERHRSLLPLQPHGAAKCPRLPAGRPRAVEEVLLRATTPAGDSSHRTGARCAAGAVRVARGRGGAGRTQACDHATCSKRSERPPRWERALDRVR